MRSTPLITSLFMVAALGGLHLYEKVGSPLASPVKEVIAFACLMVGAGILWGGRARPETSERTAQGQAEFHLDLALLGRAPDRAPPAAPEDELDLAG